ncbi:hypothetical protein SLH49_13010 [Cognatiyoonia sp. IB215446]|uniref:hypothetical protein n=1 Tax=Cognatiyoonia sp. IB215446 TaxID=3097355 RepID=UPI002A111B39|nr:hypothetical protein [Cognatiyoonia sp. IB215446]MDX8348899.1 hypothetical protein [Cognatiyoonia sp. IB215446]
MDWNTLPDDVIEWVRLIMRACNDDVTERVVNQPNIREPSLDDAFINKVSQFAAPKALPSGAVVMLEIHNIGGLRQFDKWELADIAFVVHVSMFGKLLDQKIGLLQSKRLYPENCDVDDDDPVSFRLGLNGLIEPRSGNALSKLQRKYEFLEDSRYQAIRNPDKQLQRIKHFHEQFKEAIFYLLYNPSEVPFQTSLPASTYQSVSFPPVGARVVRSSAIDDALTADADDTKGPSISSVKKASGTEYWRLEHWVADLLMRCKVGRRYTQEDTDLIDRLIRRRSGPIGAAIRVNIDLPEG